MGMKRAERGVVHHEHNKIPCTAKAPQSCAYGA